MKLWYNFHLFPNLLFGGKTSQSPNVVLSRRQLTPPSVSKPAIRLCRSAVRIICLQKVYSLNIVWENNCNHNRLLSKKREKENNENIWLVGMHSNLETLDHWWYKNSLEGIEFEDCQRCLQISVYIDFPIAIERLLNDWICALCIGFVLSVLIFLLPNLTWSYFHFQFALRAFGRYI